MEIGRLTLERTDGVPIAIDNIPDDQNLQPRPTRERAVRVLERPVPGVKFQKDENTGLWLASSMRRRAALELVDSDAARSGFQQLAFVVAHAALGKQHKASKPNRTK